ncbi:PucR family transcriptional regulator [Nocardia cyriacigeorgica]|nr:helix-turn-helix domain-containing protein [Nocardia cyriacigeorgica]NEW27130.1 PucR family transcriptional regulator [Nocardia cyriacigeorgica]
MEVDGMTVTSDELWPEPSDRVRELFRDVAETMLTRHTEILADMEEATLRDPRYLAIAQDPVLAESSDRVGVFALKKWLTSNIAAPGARVPPPDSEETRTYARNVVLRGLTTDEVTSWRAGQYVVWRWWLAECFRVARDLDELESLVAVSACSLTTAVDDAIAALAQQVDDVREEFAGGAQLQRYATVELLLQGADIAPARAEAQLGYALTGSHIGAVVWTDSERDAHALEAVSEQLMRACGAASRLTVVAGTAAQWLWIPAKTVPPAADLEEMLSRHPRARVALGRAASGINGFRRTHLDAAAAQRLLSRLRSNLAVIRYEDVQMIDLMSADVSQLDQFVTDVLGDFEAASPVLHQTVLTYVEEGLNRSSTADRLFTHRNTIDRRLARVDELLPRPFADRPTEVATALTVLRIRGTG